MILAFHRDFPGQRQVAEMWAEAGLVLPAPCGLPLRTGWPSLSKLCPVVGVRALGWVQLLDSQWLNHPAVREPLRHVQVAEVGQGCSIAQLWGGSSG